MPFYLIDDIHSMQSKLQAGTTYANTTHRLPQRSRALDNCFFAISMDGVVSRSTFRLCIIYNYCPSPFVFKENQIWRQDASFGPLLLRPYQCISIQTAFWSHVETRVWCIFEIFTAHTNSCKVDIVMPAKETASLLQDIITEGSGINGLYEILGKTQVRNAKGVAKDRLEILARIESTVGCQVLNRQVNNLLRVWMQQVLVRLAETNENTNDLSFMKYCKRVGMILDSNGDHGVALEIYEYAMPTCCCVLRDHPEAVSTYYHWTCYG
jgi:hypothetical protein